MKATALMASLALANVLAAEAANGFVCGAGIGDLRMSEESKSACEACGGRLAYDQSAADGMGYTGCAGRQSPSPAPAAHDYRPASQTRACGAGIGDLRGSEDSKSACEACGGKLDYDQSAADGMGYTGCAGRSSAPAPSVHHDFRPAPETTAAPAAAAGFTCGAGIGDLRESEATKSACEACRGKIAYDASMADGLGYTYCAGGRPPVRAPAAHLDYRPEESSAPVASAPASSGPEAGEGFSYWGRSLVVLVAVTLLALPAKLLWSRYRAGPKASGRTLTEADLKAEPAKPDASGNQAKVDATDNLPLPV